MDIYEAPVEDDIDDEDKDPGLPHLEALTEAGNPFILPWSLEIRTILSGFDSRYIACGQKSPWISKSPFDRTQVMLTTVLHDQGSGKAVFREARSTGSSNSRDHLSAAVGLTVGYPCLNAGVHVDYDRKVLEDKRGSTTSRNATCIVGRVIVAATPPLSAEAIRILRSAHGEARFRAEYGDFFVTGYTLGADAGARMTTETSSRSEYNRLSAHATSQLLWISVKSPSVTKEWSDFAAATSMSFNGYSTLNGEKSALEMPRGRPDMLADMHARIKAYLAKVSALEHGVRMRLEELGLKDGEAVPLAICPHLCRSGLVTQLVLAPFARLAEYVGYASMPKIS